MIFFTALFSLFFGLGFAHASSFPQWRLHSTTKDCPLQATFWKLEGDQLALVRYNLEGRVLYGHLAATKMNPMQLKTTVTYESTILAQIPTFIVSQVTSVDSPEPKGFLQVSFSGTTFGCKLEAVDPKSINVGSINH